MVLREEAPAYPLFRGASPALLDARRPTRPTGVLKVSRSGHRHRQLLPAQLPGRLHRHGGLVRVEATSRPRPGRRGPARRRRRPPRRRPGWQVEYLDLRPAEDDVGYVPQHRSTEPGPTIWAIPRIYVGMWTRGANVHYGMVQFDLAALPAGATVVDARLELIGRDQSSPSPAPGRSCCSARPSTRRGARPPTTRCARPRCWRRSGRPWPVELTADGRTNARLHARQLAARDRAPARPPGASASASTVRPRATTTSSAGIPASTATTANRNRPIRRSGRCCTSATPWTRRSRPRRRRRPASHHRRSRLERPRPHRRRPPRTRRHRTRQGASRPARRRNRSRQRPRRPHRRGRRWSRAAAPRRRVRRISPVPPTRR